MQFFKNWKDCQRLCNPQGVNGFNRKVLLLDPAKVNPEIVARSDELLQDCDINKVRTVGPGAGTFYVWVRFNFETFRSSIFRSMFIIERLSDYSLECLVVLSRGQAKC